MVGVDSCIAWLHEEPKVGGEARPGKTCPCLRTGPYLARLYNPNPNYLRQP